MDAVDKRKCSSKKFIKSREKAGEDVHECNNVLLILSDPDGNGVTYLCDVCDALEMMPIGMRERIHEQ